MAFDGWAAGGGLKATPLNTADGDEGVAGGDGASLVFPNRPSPAVSGFWPKLNSPPGESVFTSDSGGAVLTAPNTEGGPGSEKAPVGVLGPRTEGVFGDGALDRAGTGVLEAVALEPGLSLWQETHWVLSLGLLHMQVEQVHRSSVAFGLDSPAAPQLKPLDAVGGGGGGDEALAAASLDTGRGSSQAMHFEAVS